MDQSSLISQQVADTVTAAVSAVTTTTTIAFESMPDYGASADRHPVVSFLSAFFWVVRTSVLVGCIAWCSDGADDIRDVSGWC